MLNFISIEGEWYLERYEPLVETVTQNSFGMFRPTGIADERDRQKGTATLAFTVEGQRYLVTAEDSAKWVPTEFLELVEAAFATHCNKLRFHETLLCTALPAASGTTWTICTNRATPVKVSGTV